MTSDAWNTVYVYNCVSNSMYSILVQIFAFLQSKAVSEIEHLTLQYIGGPEVADDEEQSEKMRRAENQQKRDRWMGRL